eukprot:TRINITY_DN5883_c0_g1_i2.p1 TRINITY_DN5883_c0_g1~~TRINITY_DN5883_c0_g1_i2.p1  ORF type:complete len:180 (+),score=5.17 TRINITY_DN5883_c0_g1_i2:46-585(+)
MKATQRLLFSHRLRPMKAYSFRNRKERSVEETIADLNDRAMQEAHLPGEYHLSLMAQIKAKTYDGDFRLFWCMTTIFVCYFMFLLRTARPDIAQTLPPPFGGNHSVVGSGVSGGRYNWDDLNCNNPSSSSDSSHAMGGSTYLSPQRTRLRYDRYTNSEALREIELRESDALICEIKMNM